MRKFTRIKGDSSYPVNSINHAVDLASKNNLVISKICIHENYFLRKTGVREASGFKSKLRTAVKWAKNIVLDLSELETTQKLLGIKSEDIFVSNHHLSHVYGSVLKGKMRNGLAVVFDAIGESSSGLVAKIDNFKIAEKIVFPINKSVGLVYSALTVFCGFKVLTGEYKLMGLAPYGAPIYKDVLKEIFFDKSGSITISDIDITSSQLCSRKLEKALRFRPRQTTDTEMYRNMLISSFYAACS